MLSTRVSKSPVTLDESAGEKRLSDVNEDIDNLNARRMQFILEMMDERERDVMLRSLSEE
ncbi:hypothetical protein AB4K05_14470 [Kluyvera sp. STS39-E]|uniref:hypothetical protein n=1 Tax=Kluyvera sp. STS39-E TaxID=3234748 RepID=UPI0034C614A7